MKAHPIIDYPYRWIPILLLLLVLVAAQVALVCLYTGADYLPALVDGIATMGWLAALAYLAWYVVGLVSLLQTDIIMIVVGSLLWLAGCFMVCDSMVRIAGISYIPFTQTIPFRLLFGLPVLIAVTLWYRLITAKEEVLNQELEKELIEHQVVEAPVEVPAGLIDRITVKDGSRIHLIKADELIYIQACGDYVMLITPSGEYLKEQTMKYFETHLPPETFVRVHRSTIVNVTQISRVELFGKETYQLLKETPSVNFVGNMESRDLLSGSYDLVVCDGFSGNVLIKSTEGACLELLKLLKSTFMASFKNKLGALLLKKDIMNIKSFMDYNNYGGAVLLGCSKTIVKGHGSSKAAAVYNCVKQAYNMEKNNLCEAISEEITKLTVTENEN